MMKSASGSSSHRIRSHGFTLIELSIVIVIIGLIAGGVLFGRDLIRAAKVRMQISQIDEINAAVVTFKIKYNCLPGDCRSATQLLGGGAQPQAVSNGDGDGLIRGFGTWDNQVATNTGWGSFNGNNGAGLWIEWGYVFDQLAAARLVAMNQYDETASASNAPGIGYPLMKLQGEGNGPIHNTFTNNGPGGVVVGYEPAGPGADGVFTVTGGHKIRLGAAVCNPGAWGPFDMCFQAGLSAAESLAIDSKIDDGKPMTGRAVITNSGYIYNVESYPYCIALPANNYLAAPAVWGGETITRYCALSINAAF